MRRWKGVVGAVANDTEPSVIVRRWFIRHLDDSCLRAVTFFETLIRPRSLPRVDTAPTCSPELSLRRVVSTDKASADR